MGGSGPPSLRFPVSRGVRLGQGGAGEPGRALAVPIVPGMGFMAPAFQFVMDTLSSNQIRYNATPAT